MMLENLHSSIETKSCYPNDYNDSFKIKPWFFSVTSFSFTSLASFISWHCPSYNVPSGNGNPLVLPWLCVALHEYVNSLLKVSCRDYGGPQYIYLSPGCWPWAIHLTCSYFSFLTCKIRLVTVLTHGIVMRIEWVHICKELGTVTHTSKCYVNVS